MQALGGSRPEAGAWPRNQDVSALIEGAWHGTEKVRNRRERGSRGSISGLSMMILPCCWRGRNQLNQRLGAKNVVLVPHEYG